MPTPDEIRKMHLERDHLLEVNRSMPGRPFTISLPLIPGFKGKVRDIANRAHETYGCFGPDEGCPFCEILELTKS